MNWDVYLRVSALMFLEFAIWGVWMPVLALRLLGPLKMNGKQTGWIYSTLPLACIFAPLASGYLADSVFSAEHIILVAHALGAVLLFAAAKQTKFWGMFWVMLAYSVCYTATLPLVNKVLFQHIPEQATWVFLWAPVAWALVGYFLTGLRQACKWGGDGPDALYVAAILSVAMVLMCLIQPATPPKLASAAMAAATVTNPVLEAIEMLGNGSYLIFMLTQLVVSGMMQFYFLGTGQFMQDRGISGKNVSAAMGVAQAAQAAATILLLGGLIEKAGYQWTFAIGALCWTILFVVYVLSTRSVWLVPFQVFHGLAYVFFIIGGQMFVGAMAPSEISASAQSLIFIATTGIGLFLGTQLAGIVMDTNCIEGKFQWKKIWAVPLVITLAGTIVFAVAFKPTTPADFQRAKPAQEQTAMMDTAT
jgi:MFS family permease